MFALVQGSSSIVKITAANGVQPFSSGGLLNTLFGLGIDTQQSLFVGAANTIVKIASDGTQSTLTSGGNLNAPRGVVCDPSGQFRALLLLLDYYSFQKQQKKWSELLE